MIDTTVVAFPPGRGNVGVPAGSRRAACAGIALYGPCRPLVLAAVHGAWLAAAVAGPRVLPGRPQPWTPPLPPEAWRRLVADWRAALGEVDALAVHERVQRSREGFSTLLLRDARPVAFVKTRRGEADALAHERRALAAVAASRPTGWSAPAPLANGATDGWSWVAATALPPRPHRPASRVTDVAGIAADVQDALARMPAPVGTPAHWRPMHGDLTPWNLRRVAGRLWLVDWEDTGWGPPDADVVYHTATRAALGRRARVRPVPRRSEEAVRFWEERVAARARDDADADLTRRLLAALAALRGAPSRA